MQAAGLIFFKVCPIYPAAGRILGWMAGKGIPEKNTTFFTLPSFRLTSNMN